MSVAALAASTASAAPRHSPSACAVAWNHWAGQSLHRAVARSDARRAFVDANAVVGTYTWSRGGGVGSTSSPGCTIRFVLPGGAGLLEVWGRWRAGAVRAWHGPNRGKSPLPVRGNARVRGDGTVGFTG